MIILVYYWTYNTHRYQLILNIYFLVLQVAIVKETTTVCLNLSVQFHFDLNNEPFESPVMCNALILHPSPHTSALIFFINDFVTHTYWIFFEMMSTSFNLFKSFLFEKIAFISCRWNSSIFTLSAWMCFQRLLFFILTKKKLQ